MLVTIGYITIFSAIFVFFSDELLRYAKSMSAKPFVFLVFTLLTASALLVMFARLLLLTVVTYWIYLLSVVQWLMQHLWFQTGAQLVAQWIVLVVLAAIPVVITTLLAQRKNSLPNIQQWGYEISIVVWLFTLLLFVVGVPGATFVG